MTLIFKGKTKDVYDLHDGTYFIRFKDDATGRDGVFDPGENQVGLTIDGMGMCSLRMTEYFFTKIAETGLPTHLVSVDMENSGIVVKPAKNFGKIGGGLEFICRFRAAGSFVRRYAAYAHEGQPLDALVEITLKDDERGDPPINKETLLQLGLMNEEEFTTLVSYTKKIAYLIEDDLSDRDLELGDIKLEFGRLSDGKIVLIDEISGGCMKVYRDGRLLAPLELGGVLEV
jgi:phosphoribosylaminoimidazole-succinocarboxamide synthase